MTIKVFRVIYLNLIKYTNYHISGLNIYIYIFVSNNDYRTI